ncbi:conserved hypothetical protein [Thiomonas sp. X19]|uniref:TubC N-terminal docking domain-related protein n=1 Tax=Thiomonas sp. X19 TaxID=1050370 RepID=UPI000B6ADC4B|nr:hypothetical protein [Thiomonas sp. X19]SCC93433.1 conserved hypothetical protein [Thiomonas sp. X19]
MNPSALLADLRVSGFTIQPDGDTLIVSPASRLTDDLREAIRQTKPDLMALLWAENLREHFEERAAILECDGGLSRNEAEANARASTGLLARNLGLPWRALREALGDPDLPDTLTPVDGAAYGLPHWCVSPTGRAIRQGFFRHDQGTA